MAAPLLIGNTNNPGTTNITQQNGAGISMQTGINVNNPVNVKKS
jgi:hypothetical protein